MVRIIRSSVQMWQFMLVALSGWINWQSQQIIEDLKQENQAFCEQYGGKRLRFTDVQ